MFVGVLRDEIGEWMGGRGTGGGGDLRGLMGE